MLEVRTYEVTLFDDILTFVLDNFLEIGLNSFLVGKEIGIFDHFNVFDFNWFVCHLLIYNSYEMRIHDDKPSKNCFPINEM